MKRHIVFDFDGTLVNSVEVVVKVYNELADQYKFNKIDPTEYRNMMNLSLREKIKVLNVPMFRVLLIRKFSRDFKSNYKLHLKSLVFFEGIREVINKLSEKGYTISIITSNSESNIIEYMEHQGVACINQVKSSNGLFGKDKSLRQYMRTNRLSSKDLLYIGDEVRDIQACKKMNVEVIAVTWGMDSKQALLSEHPNYIAENPNEVLDIIVQS